MWAEHAHAATDCVALVGRVPSEDEAPAIVQLELAGTVFAEARLATNKAECVAAVDKSSKVPVEVARERDRGKIGHGPGAVVGAYPPSPTPHTPLSR